MNKANGGGQLAPMRLQTAQKRNQLIGSLQQRFGYSRARAQHELKRRLAKHHPRVPRARGLKI